MKLKLTINNSFSIKIVVIRRGCVRLKHHAIPSSSEVFCNPRKMYLNRGWGAEMRSKVLTCKVETCRYVIISTSGDFAFDHVRRIHLIPAQMYFPALYANEGSFWHVNVTVFSQIQQCLILWSNKTALACSFLLHFFFFNRILSLCRAGKYLILVHYR